jgi:hypothetical protein
MKPVILLFALVPVFAALACSSSTTTPPGGGGSGGGTAGCSAGADCAPDEYCDFPDDRCGAGEPGVCEKRPTVCSDGAWIVCSCEGTIEYAGCQTLAGFDTNVDASACTQPGGVFDDVFACGDRFCLTGISYCQLAVSDVGGIPDVYSCELLPSSCGGAGQPTCACLSGEACGAMCDDGGAGEVTLTCPGG